MKASTKNLGLILGTLLTTAIFATPAFSADASLTTGGYAKQLHKMELMKMLDGNGDHMVTLEEFNSFNTSVFDELDTDHDGSLDAKEWVGKTIGEQPISVATGGYSRELRKMKMMGLMDADGDHKITKEEFLAHQQKVFSAMDKSGDGQLTANEWLGKHL